MKNISLNSENLKLNTQIKVKENLINKNNNKLKELNVTQELNEKNINEKLSQKNKDFKKIKNNFENEKNKLNEKIRELENEIDNYKIRNLKIVIIHGNGSGIIKKTTQETLKKSKLVESYKIDNFNSGMTIVELHKTLDK